FSGFGASREPLSLQLQQSAAVVLWRDFHKRRDSIAPVFQECARPGAAGEQVMTFEENTQSCGVETQRVAHAVVMDTRRALPRAVVRVSIVVGPGGDNRFELDLVAIAQAGEAALRVPDIGDAARHAGGEIPPGIADDD